MSVTSSPEQVHVIPADQLDYTFAEEILAEPGGEHLYTCSSCGTCAGTCLIRRFDPDFNPRLLITKAVLGLRDEVLSGPESWECSACDACYGRCPKQIHISEVMKAIRNVAIRSGYERPGVTAEVNVATCVACGMCVAACPYQAISLETVKWNRTTKPAAKVDRNLCMACGICNAACPSSSISVEGNEDAQLHDSLVAKAHALKAILGRELRGKALAIVCNWCLHATMDVNQATSPPTGVEVIRVPCAGRVSPLLTMTALQRGADIVLTVGCKETECHFRHGNELGARRTAMLGELLSLMGLDRSRVRFARVGALERGKFSRLISKAAAN